MGAEINVTPNKQVVVEPAKKQSPAIIDVSKAIIVADTIKDVSLFAYYDRDYVDWLYVKAPKGLIKETDNVIFARYITGKTRPRNNRETLTGERYKYRGWIRPKKVDRSYPSKDWDYLFDDSYFSLYFVEYRSSEEYDVFELRERNGIEIVDCLANTYITNTDKLNVSRKCGICIQRNGKTIVDYLPFRIVYDDRNGCYHASRV